MTKHLYITNVDVFESEHQQVEFAKAAYYGESMPTLYLGEGNTSMTDNHMAYEVLTSSQFDHAAYVPFDKHHAPIHIHTHIGMSNQAKNALITYIGCVSTLRDELQFTTHQLNTSNRSLAAERRKIECQREMITTAYNASLWQRIKWVFTGVML